MIIEIDTIKINFEEAGSGKPLVLLHGWGTDSKSWSPIIEQFSANFCTYQIDLPGFGGSSMPKETWGISEYVELLKKTLEKLDLGKVFLLGHSFGGNLAWVLAAKYPNLVDKLVLVNSSGVRKQSQKVKFISNLAKITPDFIKKTFSTTFYKSIGEHDYETAGPLKESFKKIVNDDQTFLLEKIQIPTLIIWGEDDKDTPITHAYFYRSEIKDSKLYILSEAGHFSFLDRPADFIKLSTNFLND